MCKSFFKDHTNEAICYLASLKAYNPSKLTLEGFFQFRKMDKNLWDRLPYFHKQFLKTRKSCLSQMPALFVYKNDFA